MAFASSSAASSSPHSSSFERSLVSQRSKASESFFGRVLTFHVDARFLSSDSSVQKPRLNLQFSKATTLLRQQIEELKIPGVRGKITSRKFVPLQSVTDVQISIDPQSSSTLHVAETLPQPPGLYTLSISVNYKEKGSGSKTVLQQIHLPEVNLNPDLHIINTISIIIARNIIQVNPEDKNPFQLALVSTSPSTFVINPSTDSDTRADVQSLGACTAAGGLRHKLLCYNSRSKIDRSLAVVSAKDWFLPGYNLVSFPTTTKTTLPLKVFDQSSVKIQLQQQARTRSDRKRKAPDTEDRDSRLMTTPEFNTFPSSSSPNGLGDKHHDTLEFFKDVLNPGSDPDAASAAASSQQPLHDPLAALNFESLDVLLAKVSE